TVCPCGTREVTTRIGDDGGHGIDGRRTGCSASTRAGLEEFETNIGGTDTDHIAISERLLIDSLAIDKGSATGAQVDDRWATIFAEFDQRVNAADRIIGNVQIDAIVRTDLNR